MIKTIAATYVALVVSSTVYISLAHSFHKCGHGLDQDALMYAFMMFSLFVVLVVERCKRVPTDVYLSILFAIHGVLASSIVYSLFKMSSLVGGRIVETDELHSVRVFSAYIPAGMALAISAMHTIRTV
jgi:hypothetical protein